MSGGYQHLTADPNEQLLRELTSQRRRLDELEKPTGSQLSPLPIAATGGDFSVINVNTTTGMQWQPNAAYGAVTFTVPATASGTILVTVSAALLANQVTNAGQMFTYVGYNLAGGNSSVQTSCLMVYAINAENRLQASRVVVDTVSPGQTYTARLTAGYEHFNGGNGFSSANYMSIAVQVLA